jgi:hypothetical protein
MRQRAETPHVPDRMPWLVEIGQQLRAEYTHNAELADPLPEQLAAQLKQLEAGATPPEPAAVRLAIINAVVRACVAPRPPDRQPMKNGLLFAAPADLLI